MKMLPLRQIALISASFVFAALLRAQPDPGGNPSSVQYNPQEKVVQGNQPLDQTYVLTIISPSNLTPGVSVPITLNRSVLAKPAGVSDVEALAHLTLTPQMLTFTGPNQALNVTVRVQVLLGSVAGSFAYKILPSGWPLTANGILDAGATVNAIATAPGSTDTTPPAVILNAPAAGSSYTYRPATGVPVNVPVSFSATVGATGQPVDSMLASISGPAGTLPVTITTSALPSFSATATGSVNLAMPGNYTVSVAATNRFGTSYASSAFTVLVVAPPPTITVSSPGANAAFSYTLGGAGASVPVGVTVNSLFGNITSLGATLDGLPISLNTSGVNGSVSASGSASLTVSATGSHTLVFTAANAYGSATPVTVPFTVTGTFPAPSVSILSPASGTSYARVAGDPATVVNFGFQGGTSYGTITSAVVTLDGVALAPPPTLTGLNTANISGTGSMSFTAGGPHTLSVKLTNSGGAVASASTSFTINQTLPLPSSTLIWLPPISLNKTIEGGSTMPIKFTLEKQNKFVRDTSVLIATYEVFQNGSHSNPVIYPYGTGSPNPPDYAIEGKQYHLNFTTAKGTHSYQVEVYSKASGTMQLLGSKELNTKGSATGGHDDDDDDDDEEDDDGHDDDHGHG